MWEHITRVQEKKKKNKGTETFTDMLQKIPDYPE